MVKKQICQPKISDAGTLSTAPAPEEHRQCNLTEEIKIKTQNFWFGLELGLELGLVLEPW